MNDDQKRYRFLLGFLIEKGVITNKRYHNGTWCLCGIYGIDDSGLKGAGRTPEEAIDNAIVANQLDAVAAHKFWRATHDALAAPQPAPTMADALAAGDGTLHGAVDHWQQRALRAEAALKVEPGEAEKDAARYLWICTADHFKVDRMLDEADDKRALDAAIDSEIGAALATNPSTKDHHD